MLYLILFSILFIVSNIVIAAVVSHKMVGPIVQFLRHTQCLRNKDFSSRIQLRKNDGFSELANELNELANDLENKSK
jgi:nitrogen fixation/metabolism regulation signal transduction histidine kinase